MELVSRRLVLSFTTAGSSGIDITIANPDPSLQASTIKSAMDAVVAANALGDEALVNGVEGAKYMISQVEDVVFE